MWFKKLTGFHETSAQDIHEKILLNGEEMVFLPTEKRLNHGALETPSLRELRERTTQLPTRSAPSSVEEIVADVTKLHCDPSNSAAIFQVASQFNLLEMISPDISPEDGIDIYDCDATQGPACAIACGAGTIYRNYFINIDGQTGQTTDRQIDCLDELGKALGNEHNQLWKMVNGYALPSREGLEQVSQILENLSEPEIDQLRAALKIGIQWNTQVTLNHSSHTVSQAFCSAMPVAYSALPDKLWEPLAKLILEAAYEATLRAAVLNDHLNHQNTVYLTLLGGGAFGNQPEWILPAIQRAIDLHKDCDLDIKIVSYGQSNPELQRLRFT